MRPVKVSPPIPSRLLPAFTPSRIGRCPPQILAVITAARLAGVTHIIEEGRYGGLSALIYALHGFKVTSVEFLPLDAATVALKAMAPTDNPIELIDGDGTQHVGKYHLGRAIAHYPDILGLTLQASSCAAYFGRPPSCSGPRGRRL